MASIKTKWFSSTMAGAPVLSGSAGALINVLDTCLKDGFNLLTLDSLVVASNVATATKASHGYVANQVVTLAGITGACSAINGDVRVASVTSGTFTFVTSGISDQTATGTITSKAAAAGWEKQFSGTNLAVYRSGDGASSRQCIKVDDTGTLFDTVTAAESFTDISTPINQFLTHYFKKSNAASAAARPWVIVADDKSVYLGVNWNDGTIFDLYHFGDFASFVSGDQASFRLQGLSGSAPAAVGQYSSVNDAYICSPNYGSCSRSYAQVFGVKALSQGGLVGSLVPVYSNTNIFAHSGNRGAQSTAGMDVFVAPSLADNGYHFFPVYLIETAVSGKMIRGLARGLMHVAETLPISSGYSILSGVENVTGGLVMLIASAGYSALGAIQVPAVSAFTLGDF